MGVGVGVGVGVSAPPPPGSALFGVGVGVTEGVLVGTVVGVPVGVDDGMDVGVVVGVGVPVGVGDGIGVGVNVGNASNPEAGAAATMLYFSWSCSGKDEKVLARKARARTPVVTALALESVDVRVSEEVVFEIVAPSSNVTLCCGSRTAKRSPDVELIGTSVSVLIQDPRVAL